MELEQLCKKLQSIIGKPVSAGNAEEDRDGGGVREVVSAAGVQVVVYGELTHAERQLIAWLLEAERGGVRGKNPAGEDERLSGLLSAWIMERVEQGDHDADLPESLARWPMLGGVKVPLLVYGDHPERRQTPYSELKKLLKSFFEAEVVLVPLHNGQWLILADETLLTEQRDDNEETLEDSLSALAMGLQDMAASEWVGECHVAATYPFTPGTSLIQTVITLRETIELGRSYRLSSYIHLPWELRLETLLDAAPKRAKARFLEGVLRRGEPSFDPEMLQTLDAFFTENCNVSDTAKRLYIHRNTLLYRLDKFKQETGMDVRDFEHAVLVRLALLLYKVTKRK